jgi:hypothetical protein
LNTIEGESKNTETNDMAPVLEKYSECLEVKPNLPDSLKVKASSEYIKLLFDYVEEAADSKTKRIIDNMTRDVESLYFTDFKSGFASFSHPPAAEFLMGQNLPFEKDINAGGTDIFYFSPDRNDEIKFRTFSKINSPFWDSHPIAITNPNSQGICVTLLIFSSDRLNPFSKAINTNGDTIYGGSTDLFYSFGKYKIINSKDLSIDNFQNFEWTTPHLLTGANTTDYNEGTPFIYCQSENPILIFSSNRNNSNIHDFDLYVTKLNIDYDKLSISVIETPELIDTKSQTTDSLTYSINTVADERFPYIPFPHLENAADNPLYFSSDRNRKPDYRECNCERGNDRTENIGGYDIYKYELPEKFNCPKPKEIIPVIYEPELFAEIVVINLEEPETPIKNASIKLIDDNGNIIEESSNSGNLRVKLDFDKQYQVIGGSSFNSMDCLADDEIIFRGYKAPEETYYEKQRDSSSKIELLTSFSMKASEFLKINQDVTRKESGFIIEKGIKLPSDDIIHEKVINARITGDMVYYDKQITTTKHWNSIDLRPSRYTGEFAAETALRGGVRSIGTMNEKIFAEKPESNEIIILYDTIYLLPDYILKPPCYCEFSGVLTTYQQNVPYFQTGFWQVNTLKNYRRDIPELDRSKYSEARWIELHKNNQYFGEGMKGRFARSLEYEEYAKVVDSNLYKMAEMISRQIIPAFKIIDSITPGSKLIISLDAWSDRRPVRRGWYIGDEVNYVEGSLIEGVRDYDVDFHKVLIPDKSSLNMNNDTLSRLRAYYGYLELLNKLLDTASVGTGFYDYYKAGLTLLPDDEKLTNTNLNLPFSLKSVEELIFKSKIILLARGNYFDPTEYKIPRYIRDVDSSLFMLDTIRRIDVTINTLQYQAGKLIKSECCNPNLPCVDYRRLLNLNNAKPDINATEPRRRKK